MPLPPARSRPDPSDLISDLQLLAYDAQSGQTTAPEDIENLCKEISLYVTSDDSDAPLFVKALAGDEEAFDKIEADNEEDILLDTPRQINFSIEYALKSPVIGRMVAIVVARQLKLDSDEFDSPSDEPEAAPEPPPESTGWRWQPN